MSERAQEPEGRHGEQHHDARSHDGARDDDERPRGDRRREHVVDEAPAEREREEDRREERGVLRRPPEHAHERDHRPRHEHERRGDDEPARELDRQHDGEARDEQVKEAVVGEIVELIGRVLGRRRILQAAGDVAEGQVLRVVDAGQQPGDEEARDDERDAGPVQGRQPARPEREVVDPPRRQRPRALRPGRRSYPEAPAPHALRRAAGRVRRRQRPHALRLDAGRVRANARLRPKRGLDVPLSLRRSGHGSPPFTAGPPPAKADQAVGRSRRSPPSPPPGNACTPEPLGRMLPGRRRPNMRSRSAESAQSARGPLAALVGVGVCAALCGTIGALAGCNTQRKQDCDKFLRAMAPMQGGAPSAETIDQVESERRRHPVRGRAAARVRDELQEHAHGSLEHAEAQGHRGARRAARRDRRRHQAEPEGRAHRLRRHHAVLRAVAGRGPRSAVRVAQRRAGRGRHPSSRVL